MTAERDRQAYWVLAEQLGPMLWRAWTFGEGVSAEGATEAQDYLPAEQS